MSILKKVQQTIQYIFSVPQQVIRYILGAASRIFSPTDDQYPATGVQPFEGEIPDHRGTRHNQV